MKVDFLPSSSYLGVEVQNPDEVGISEGSHIAAVEFPGSKKPQRCYVKFCGPEEYSLFYEILGYTLAHYLNLRQPEKAAIIIVPIKKLLDVGCKIPKWIPKDASFFPAFCTVESPVRSIRYLYNTEALLISKYNEMFKSCDTWYSCVAAFDEWLANNDRNGGNILMLSETVFSIIDHGRLLDNRPPSFKSHNKNMRSENLMRKVVEDYGVDDDHEKLKNGMTAASHKHKSATNSSEAEILSWLKYFNNIDHEVVIQFIKERSQDNWMEDRMGVI